jgi:hypothetical protein
MADPAAKDDGAAPRPEASTEAKQTAAPAMVTDTSQTLAEALDIPAEPPKIPAPEAGNAAAAAASMTEAKAAETSQPAPEEAPDPDEDDLSDLDGISSTPTILT